MEISVSCLQKWGRRFSYTLLNSGRFRRSANVFSRRYCVMCIVFCLEKNHKHLVLSPFISLPVHGLELTTQTKL